MVTLTKISILLLPLYARTTPMGAIINDNSQKGLATWKNKFGIQIIIQNKIEIKDKTLNLLFNIETDPL